MTTITVTLPPKQMMLFQRLLIATRHIAWTELDATPEDVDAVIDAFLAVIKAYIGGGTFTV